MPLWVVVLLVWLAASVLLVAVYAIGAGIGYRRGFEHGRASAMGERSREQGSGSLRR